MENGWLKWVGVAALSAVVSSGVTLAAVTQLSQSNLLHLSTSNGTVASAPSTSSASATPVSTNVAANDSITQIVKQVEPAVVGVVNYQDTSSQDPFSSGGASSSNSVQPYGVGTGVLFYKDSQSGYFVTNNHVVQGAAKVEVVLKSGQHVHATVIGTDPYTDLAVLKIPVKSVQNVEPLQFANSDTLQAGDTVVAIGTPMGLDFAESVTSGIISAPKRLMPVEEPDTQQTLDYQTVIQTDAAINPGNSGGPLLNLQGQVVGINSSKIVTEGVEGMGFSIPANLVQEITKQIMKTGHAEHPALGLAGISLDGVYANYLNNAPVDHGVLVQSVTSSEAKASGIQPRDIIVEIDGKPVNTIADLRTELFSKQPGDSVTLQVYRGSKPMTVKVKLGTMSTQNDAVPGQSQDSVPSSIPSSPFDGFGGFGG